MGDASRPALVTSLPRFLVAAGVAAPQTVLLDAEQARHVRVRRLRSGDAVALFDGGGRSFRGVIAEISRRGVMVSISEELPHRSAESVLDVTLALASIKPDRFEWAIEKATELGVARVRPFISQRSLARPSPARLHRWRQIARGAAKQAGRSIVPAVDAPVAFDDVLADSDGWRMLCWERPDGLAQRPRPAELRKLTVIIGPEGGFTEAEASAAAAAGCEIMSLGPRMLRAETAAVVAVALCQSRWGDLADPLR
jgi:16S rRNA (uracil1498-N3)-methyltransferase